MIDWLFRNRATGRITIAQFPNVPLGVFLIATAIRIVIDPTGTWGTVVSVVGTAGLGWWAVDEMLRGVNPWRRFLGGAVLAAIVAGLISRVGG